MFSSPLRPGGPKTEAGDRFVDRQRLGVKTVAEPEGMGRRRYRRARRTCADARDEKQVWSACDVSEVCEQKLSVSGEGRGGHRGCGGSFGWLVQKRREGR